MSSPDISLRQLTPRDMAFGFSREGVFHTLPEPQRFALDGVINGGKEGVIIYGDKTPTALRIDVDSGNILGDLVRTPNAWESRDGRSMIGVATPIGVKLDAIVDIVDLGSDSENADALGRVRALTKRRQREHDAAIRAQQRENARAVKEEVRPRTLLEYTLALDMEKEGIVLPFDAKQFIASDQVAAG